MGWERTLAWPDHPGPDQDQIPAPARTRPAALGCDQTAMSFASWETHQAARLGKQVTIKVVCASFFQANPATPHHGKGAVWSCLHSMTGLAEKGSYSTPHMQISPAPFSRFPRPWEPISPGLSSQAKRKFPSNSSQATVPKRAFPSESCQANVFKPALPNGSSQFPVPRFAFLSSAMPSGRHRTGNLGGGAPQQSPPAPLHSYPARCIPIPHDAQRASHRGSGGRSAPVEPVSIRAFL